MVFVFVLIALVIIICLLAGALAWDIYKKDRLFANIPGPQGTSFWMANAALIQPYVAAGKIQDYFFDLHQKYGKTFKVRFLNQMMISSSDPDMFKEMLISGRHPKSKLGSVIFGKLFGARYMSSSSILTETDTQKSHTKRSHYNSMLNVGYFKSMTSEFNTAIDALITRLTEVADGKTRITMLDEFNHITLDVLAKIAFGIDMGSVESESNQFTTAIYMTFKGLAIQRNSTFYMFDPRNWGNVIRTRKEVKVIRNFGRELINARQTAKAKGEYVPDDILSLIVQMKEENPDIDEENLIDDFLTFFVGGQETTAGLLSFMIINLGQNPDCMKKLQDDVDEHVGAKKVIDYNDLQRLEYLDMVVKETLRINPPVVGAAKETISEITVNGLTFPKGCDIFLNAFCTQRSEEFYEDPLTFNPDRFSGEKSIKPYTYLPFSLGSRSCIGKHFAEVEAKIIMTKLVQLFEWKLDPNQSFEMVDIITIRPEGRAAVTLTVR